MTYPACRSGFSPRGRPALEVESLGPSPSTAVESGAEAAIPERGAEAAILHVLKARPD